MPSYKFTGGAGFAKTVRQVSFRFFLHAAAQKEAGTDWQEKTLRMLTFDLTQGQSPEVKQKLIAVARTLSNPGFVTEQQREQAFAELFQPGGS